MKHKKLKNKISKHKLLERQSRIRKQQDIKAGKELKRRLEILEVLISIGGL